MRVFAISGSAVLVGLLLLGALQTRGAPALSASTSPTNEVSQTPAPPAYATIRALTYNIFMRPAPVSWADQNDCRARRIAQHLAEELRPRDVIVLTESFEQSSLQKLAEAALPRYPHQVLSQPPARGLSVNGGVSILSPHPIEAWSATAFDACYGKWNDCLATKGFVWARLRISPTIKFNVLATHLNSGGAPQARATRRSQLAQIRAFLAAHPSIARWPTLLMGDLNINGLRWEARPPDQHTLSEYAEMMEFLGNTCIGCEGADCAPHCHALPVDTFRAAQSPWAYNEAQTRPANTYNCVEERVAPCHSPNAAARWRQRLRIDYILHYGTPPDAPHLRTRTLKANTLQFADNACKTEYLSDHAALESTLEIGASPSLQTPVQTHHWVPAPVESPSAQNDSK